MFSLAIVGRNRAPRLGRSSADAKGDDSTLFAGRDNAGLSAESGLE
jgi:hypothetical protein